MDDRPQASIEQEHLEEKRNIPSREILLGELGKMNIARLNIPSRVVYALHRVGVETIDDLIPLNSHDLFLVKGLGEQSVQEIQSALKQAVESPADYIGGSPLIPRPKMRLKPKDNTRMLDLSVFSDWSRVLSQDIPMASPWNTWAEKIEPFLRLENQVHIYVLLHRFGHPKKTFGELAITLGAPGRRVQQFEKRAARNLAKYVTSHAPARLVQAIFEVMDEQQENLSLPLFKSMLTEKGVLGRFSAPLRAEWYQVEPFEILMVWLAILADRHHTIPPIQFPVNIDDLRRATHVSIRELKAYEETYHLKRRG